MGLFFETIPPSLIKWILDQKVFWVATAPLSASGHVNVSPKGGQYFGVIDEKTFWYMDLSGSGSETISHLHEPDNGRITIMFNAFEGPPRILRLWGKGRVLENGTAEFDLFVKKHDVKTIPGTRSIVLVGIHQVGTSCGFSVPFFDFKEFRTTLNDTFKKRAEKYEAGNEAESMDRYWAYKNAWSMDGLPGMHRAQVAAKEKKVAPIKKMVGPLTPKKYVHPYGGVNVEMVVIIAVVCFLIGILFALYTPFLRDVVVRPEAKSQLSGLGARLGIVKKYAESVLVL